jgi:hemerythrin superfamily protein
MARTSSASSRTTKKASSATKASPATKAASATKTAARKTAGAARKTAGAASKTAGAARETGNTAQRATGAASKSAGSAKKASSASKGRGRSTGSASRGPDALQVLIDDHRTVEQLFGRFESSGPRANKSRGDIASRVIQELSVHASIEETAFYPAIRQVEGLEDEVLEALEEHHVVKLVLNELEKMNPTDERFQAKFTVMMENVRHHVEEEENEMFDKVRRAMSNEQLEALGAALQEARGTAPRRPHPAAPDTPPGNFLANAVAAPLDAALTAGANAVDSVRRLAGRD